MRISRNRTALALAVTVTVGAGAVISTAMAAQAATGCQVTYSVTNQWPGGFGANVNVKNLGDAISAWSLTWSFAAGQTITQLWSGSYTQSGSQVAVTNASYNGSIPTGGSATFGFNGAWTTSNPVPSSFALNGVTCTGVVTTPATTQPPVTTTVPATTQPPVTTAPAAIDTTYPVTREGAYGTNLYTVFRPSNPSAVGRTMPVLVFGNGACAHTNNGEVTGILTFIASHGFVVVDTGSVNGSSNGVSSGSPIPSLLTGAITWAERENARNGAALYQRLNLSKVAAAGHSCGGLEALIAAQDSRVKSVVSIDSGLFADGSFGYQRSELYKLHSPALFMDGGPSDIAYSNTQANYNMVTVPAVLAEHSQAGHTGFITGSQMTEGMTVVVQFLDFTLNGTASARSYILGSSGLAAKANWTVRSKNF